MQWSRWKQRVFFKCLLCVNEHRELSSFTLRATEASSWNFPRFLMQDLACFLFCPFPLSLGASFHHWDKLSSPDFCFPLKNGLTWDLKGLWVRSKCRSICKIPVIHSGYVGEEFIRKLLRNFGESIEYLKAMSQERKEPDLRQPPETYTVTLISPGGLGALVLAHLCEGLPLI